MRWVLSFFSTIFAMALVILSILMYNWSGIELLLYFGWIFIVTGTVILLVASFSHRFGENDKGLINLYGGIYGLIRQPIYLSLTFIIVGVICIGQNPLSLLLGLVSIFLIHIGMLDSEKLIIIKLGEDYTSYMKKVPRANLVTGVIKYLKNKGRHSKIPSEDCDNSSSSSYHPPHSSL